MTSWFIDGHLPTEPHRPVPLPILNWFLGLFIVRLLEIFYLFIFLTVRDLYVFWIQSLIRYIICKYLGDGVF